MNVLVTQQVNIIAKCGERRDAVDQRWTDLLLRCGLMPVFIPNHLGYFKNFIKENLIQGVLLTGGNSLSAYGGNAPERDALEKFVMEYATSNNIPVFGVCRGMQVIQDFFGVQLSRVKNHVRQRHKLDVSQQSKYAQFLTKLDTVNSYHEWGAYGSVGDLIVSAYSIDGVVMAVEHSKYPIFGQMWHAERENPFNSDEIELFIAFFNANT